MLQLPEPKPGPQRYIMAFMAVILGLGLVCYMLFRFRKKLTQGHVTESESSS